MRKQHEMEDEFAEFMKQAYPNVEQSSPQYKQSKLIWLSACFNMYLKLGELAADQVNGGARTNDMLSGIREEITLIVGPTS